MSEADFKAWGEQAVAQRDTTLLRLEGTHDPEEQAKRIAQLKEGLNHL